MTKPTVFLSHASADAEPLKRLRSFLLTRTGSAIDFFMSSDGQSIPFGRNWVTSVEEALDRSKVMFTFLSPASLQSQWVPFEAGFTYARGTKVVPVALFGLDLDSLRPPLSLLQGFNVSDGPSLSNIIAVINREFDHSHDVVITDQEYRTILGAPEASADTLPTNLVSGIRIRLGQPPDNPVPALREALMGHGLDSTWDGKTLHAPGLRGVYNPDTQASRFVLLVAPELISPILASVQEAKATLVNESTTSVTLAIIMSKHFASHLPLFSQTARLFDYGVTLADKGWLRYKHVTFEVYLEMSSPLNTSTLDPQTVVTVDGTWNDTLLPTVSELLALLVERGILTASWL